MVIVLVIEVAGPDFEVVHELEPHFGVGVVDEGGEVVYVVGRLVEVLDGHRIWVSEPD